MLQPNEMLQVHFRTFACARPGMTDEAAGSAHLVSLHLACTF